MRDHFEHGPKDTKRVPANPDTRARILRQKFLNELDGNAKSARTTDLLKEKMDSARMHGYAAANPRDPHLVAKAIDNEINRERETLVHG
ncbi:MAG: hypothetical protein FWE53_05240 [Firmicutes bacterium]|nr:hypothetical protein [Bacillota bacterium]